MRSTGRPRHARRKSAVGSLSAPPPTASRSRRAALPRHPADEERPEALQVERRLPRLPHPLDDDRERVQLGARGARPRSRCRRGRGRGRQAGCRTRAPRGRTTCRRPRAPSGSRSAPCARAARTSQRGAAGTRSPTVASGPARAAAAARRAPPRGPARARSRTCGPSIVSSGFGSSSENGGDCRKLPSSETNASGVSLSVSSATPVGVADVLVQRPLDTGRLERRDERRRVAAHRRRRGAA